MHFNKSLRDRESSRAHAGWMTGGLSAAIVHMLKCGGHWRDCSVDCGPSMMV